jgi:hypothetical protein
VTITRNPPQRLPQPSPEPAFSSFTCFISFISITASASVYVPRILWHSLIRSKPSRPLLVSPLFATLTGFPQLAENSATLSPLVATLTHLVAPKSCICHSYAKQGGVGIIPRLVVSCHIPTTQDTPQIQSSHTLPHTFRHNGGAAAASFTLRPYLLNFFYFPLPAHFACRACHPLQKRATIFIVTREAQP